MSEGEIPLQASTTTRELPAETGIPYAAAPFDDSKADIILRSSDNVDFRLHRIILSLVSPFFAAMFELPQEQGSGNQGDGDGTPVIPMAEDAKTLYDLLCLCHPKTSVSAASTVDPNSCVDLLAAANKYDIRHVVDHVCQLLSSPPVLLTQTLRVWAIFTRFHFDELAIKAARATKSIALNAEDDIPELEWVTARRYHQLLGYHQKCCNVASSAITSPALRVKESPSFGWNDSFVFVAGSRSHDKNCGIDKLQTYNISGKKWWIEYLKDVIRQLYSIPLGSAAREPEILNRAVDQAINGCCSYCADNASSDMNKFSKLYEDEIDRLVAEVPLPF